MCLNRFRQRFVFGLLAFVSALNYATAIPTAPSGLSVQAMSSSHFKLTWTDNSNNEDGFLIRVSTNGTSYTPWCDVPANATAAEFRGCLPNTLYYFKISAYETGVGSADSAPVSGTSLKNPGFNTGIPLTSSYDRIQMNVVYESSDGHLITWGEYKPGATGDNDPTYAYYRTSSDGGVNWTAPAVFSSDSTYSIKAFHFVQANDGSLIAIVSKEVAGSSPRQAFAGFRRFPPASTLAHTKANLVNEANWSAFSQFTDSSNYYQHNQPRLVKLSNGDLIIPVLAGDGLFDAGNGIGTVIYKLDSTDVGSPAGQWYKVTSARITDGSSNRSRFAEPSLVEYSNGNLLCYGRTEVGRFYEVRSTDYGETWNSSVADETAIVAPTAPPYLTKVPGSSSIVLIWNPRYNSSESLEGDRLTLCSVVSADGGLTWTKFREIEYQKPDPVHGNDAYCYPTVSYNVLGENWLMFGEINSKWEERFLTFGDALFETGAVLNPGFENGITHWFNTRNMTTSTSVFYSGTSALMIGNGHADGGGYQIVDTQGSTSYEFTAYCRVTVGTDNMKIQAKDAVTGADLGSVSTSSTTFTRLTLNFTSPSTNDVKLIIWKNVGSTSAVYADEVTLR